MWVIDIRHWLNEAQTKEAVPELKNKVRHLTSIIMYATSLAVGIQVSLPPNCWRKPKKKPCTGKIEIAISIDPPDKIHWKSPVCGPSRYSRCSW
jgi:hypothetical protein